MNERHPIEGASWSGTPAGGPVIQVQGLARDYVLEGDEATLRPTNFRSDSADRSPAITT